MSTTTNVLEALQQSIVLNERIERLTNDVAKLADTQANVRERIARIETVIDVARNAATPTQGASS